MIWFLRLFPQFRNLEATLAALREANQSLLTDKLLLQDRLDSALADKDHLWELHSQSLSSERNALRMQVNHAVQKSGGGIPYPDAHSLQPESVRKPQPGGPIGRRGRMLPSQAARAHDREFLQGFAMVNDAVAVDAVE